MTFYEQLDAVIDLLRRRERVSYRALKREFDLDDALLGDLVAELVDVQRIARAETGNLLVWIGGEPSPPGGGTEPRTETRPGSAPGAPSSGEAERRQVTVMFCDLVRSTELAGRLDPEELRDLLRGYQEGADEVVRRFGGVIARYVGDGLLIYFGYPQAHEDDAERAARAGLGIVEAVGELHKRLQSVLAPLRDIPLQVRVGLHTGVAVLGTMGDSAHRDEMAAVGETPNLAARVQGQAGPDEVLLTAATHRLLRGAMACRALGPHSLKDIAAPVQLYRVLREAEAAEAVAAPAARPSSLIGREEEVGLLLDRWGQVKEGFGQIVLMSGEAGIGKSRLVEALRTHVAGDAGQRPPHEPRPVALESRCSPFHQNSALYPLAELLSQALGIQQDRPPGERLARLEQALRQFRLPANSAASLLAPLLGLSLPAAEDAAAALGPERRRQQTLETLVALILELAARHPVLLIVEDLHWVDPSTLECLGLLLDQAPTVRLLALFTARPDFRPPWASRGHLTSLTLGRFRHAQIEALIGSVAGGKVLPESVVEHVATKTDGVPLFIEELTKMLLESGLLREDADRYELVGPLPTLGIPTTLQDSLMARLDRLATVKAVAQICAAIGRTCPYGLVRAVAGLDDDTLERALGELVSAELLYRRGVPPRATYTFKHALIQDAAYQTLLKSTRHQYHERIARALEAERAEGAEPQPELLAHHYTEAGLVAEAIGHWRRAAEEALARFANLEAISHLSRSLALLLERPESPERSRQELGLQLPLAGALMVAKSWGAPEVGRVYARACALAREIGEPRQLERALGGLATSHWTRAEMRPAREIAEECLALARRSGNPVSLLRAHLTLSYPLLWSGEFGAAQAHLERAAGGDAALRSGARVSVHDPEVTARASLAAVLWMLGFPDQALKVIGEALSLAETLAHPFSTATAFYFSAMVHQFRREGSATRASAEALERVATERGFGWWAGAGRIWRAWVRAHENHDRDAVAEIRHSLAAERSSGTELSQPMGLTLLADACRTVGLIEEGLAAVAQALDTAERSDERMYEAEIHRMRGELLLLHERRDEAEGCLHRALEVSRRQQAKSLELRAAMSLGRLWRHRGRPEDARRLLAEVHGWFTEGFDTADLREAGALLNSLGGAPYTDR